MINPTAPSAAAQEHQLSQQLGAGKNVDKTAFLKLLVAQMRNQDPLKPMDNTEFVTQLAQFSNLEQVMGINSRLDTLTVQGQGLANTEVASLVGKTVTVNGTTIGLDGSGGGVSYGFTLDAPSAATKVSISDANGNVVRTLDVGARPAGFSRLAWDGKNASGGVQPAGAYKVTVQAAAANGAPLAVTQNGTGRVKAVSFNKGYPELQLDTGLSVPVSDLLQVELTPTTTVP
jgi:flagellar basal-body rod modification protein FlgD